MMIREENQYPSMSHLLFSQYVISFSSSSSNMTNPKKELNVACNYFLRLIKNHIQLTNEQINQFKYVFYEILSKRFLDHWFPGRISFVD